MEINDLSDPIAFPTDSEQSSPGFSGAGEDRWDPLYAKPALPAAGYRLDIVSCLNRSIHLLLRNFSSLVVGTFLFTFIFFLVQLPDYLLSVIIDSVVESVEEAPWRLQLVRMVSLFFTSFFSMLLTGVLLGGLYCFYLAHLRGENASMGMIFSGFGRRFPHLLMAGIVSSAATVIGFFFFIAPGIYLMVSWVFTFALVADRNLGFWEALESSRRIISGNWWRMLLLLILGGLAAASGLLFFGIGFVFTQPILFGAITYAYEDLAARRRKPVVGSGSLLGG